MCLVGCWWPDWTKRRERTCWWKGWCWTSRPCWTCWQYWTPCKFNIAHLMVIYVNLLLKYNCTNLKCIVVLTFTSCLSQEQLDDTSNVFYDSKLFYVMSCESLGCCWSCWPTWCPWWQRSPCKYAFMDLYIHLFCFFVLLSNISFVTHEFLALS